MKLDDFANLEQWATQPWGTAALGDTRRTKRAVQIGAALAANPDASLPEQLLSWRDLKAADRWLGEAAVSHRELSQPPWNKPCEGARTSGARTSAARVVLLVPDTSELDASAHTQAQDLGHIGNSKGRGLKLHSCLAVMPTPGNAEVLG